VRGRNVNVQLPYEEPTLHARRPRNHLVAIVSALAMLACVLLPRVGAIGGGGGLAAAADRSTPIVVGMPPEFTFFGRGWGHGVGMSQHGARGRALAGQDAATILAHYYAGTTLGTKDPASQVRVLLLNKFAASAAAPLVVIGRGGTWSIAGIALTFPADAKLSLWPASAGSTTWSLRVVSAGGSQLHAQAVSGGLTVVPGAAAALLQLDSKPSTYDTYRGTLRIRLSTTAIVVNDLGLDAYLRGVVPVEMPSSWPTEALRAQSIAARSYAAYRLHPGTGTFDVYDDTRSQVYRGVEGEAAATNAAIQATSGVVLKSGSAIANAMFHSTGGGATEHNENVFVSSTGEIVAGPVSYLRGSPDRAPDGTAYDAGAPLATWKTASYTLEELSAIFGRDGRTNTGALRSFDLSRRGVSGRLISVTLAGSAGTRTVSGEVFRSVFNAWRPAGEPEIRSTLFDTQPIP
jgi:SpoIID/LytB domain protein